MLDLDARVHLEEVEVLLLIDEELDRAGVGVAGRLDQPHGGVAQSLAHGLLSSTGRGRFFDQLLVAPLHRAIALPQVHGVAVIVGEDLHFDVPAELDVLLDVDRGILERVLGLGLRLLECRREARRRCAPRASRARRRPRRP